MVEMKISEVSNVDYERLSTGTRELDRVHGCQWRGARSPHSTLRKFSSRPFNHPTSKTSLLVGIPFGLRRGWRRRARRSHGDKRSLRDRRESRKSLIERLAERTEIRIDQDRSAARDDHDGPFCGMVFRRFQMNLETGTDSPHAVAKPLKLVGHAGH